jgi:hypothetical protein
MVCSSILVMNYHTLVALVTISSAVASLTACGPAPKPASPTEPQGSTAAETKTLSPLSVTNWGPTETKIGTPFNVQPSGQSAMWVAFRGNFIPSSNNYIRFADLKVTNFMQQPEAVTFAVPEQGFATAGDKRITIFEAETGRTIDVGVFKVLPSNQ